MKETILLVALVTACGFCCGCQSDDHGWRLSRGTSKTESLLVLQKHGIQPLPDEGAYDSPHHRAHCRYVITSPKSSDALFLVMEEPPDRGEYRIETIYIRRNWQADRLLPVGLRRGQTEVLSNISIDGLRHWVETGEWTTK